MESGASPELPSGIGSLALLGLRCYLRRWLLYLGFAAIAYGSDVVLFLTRPNSVPSNQIGNVILTSVAESLLIGAVSIGVLGDATGAGQSTRAIIDRTFARWWAVALINILLNLLASSTSLLPSPDNLYGLLTVALLILWAAVVLATVVAVAETQISDAWLVMHALYRGAVLAFTPANLVHTCAIGLALLIMVATQLVVATLLVQRGGHTVMWAETYGALVANALLLGPFQAIVATFSLDMARRVTAARDRPR